MQQKVIILIIFFLSLFIFPLLGSKELYAGGQNNCSDIQCLRTACGNECGPDLNGNAGCCCLEYSCNGGDNLPVNCGPGYYWSNGGCKLIGTGTSPNNPNREPQSHYGVSCALGTQLNLNKEVRRWCTRNSAPPEMQAGWRPVDDRYVLGGAERKGGCCEEQHFEECEWVYKPAYGKEVKDCHSWSECRATWTIRYACDPVAPPIVITNTVQNTGDAMGCVANAGYVGRGSNNTVRVSVTTPNTYASGTVSDMRLWVGATPLLSETISATLPQALVANNSFGLMVKKVGNAWTDVYAPTKYNAPNTPQATLQGWTKIGTISGPLTINGRDGLPMVVVTNLNITVSGASTILSADLSFNHNGLGLSSFERATNRNYVFQGGARYSNSAGNTAWVNSTSNFNLDLVPPSNDNFALSFVGGTRVDIPWTFSDVDPANSGNGILRVVGNATRIREGRVEGTIDRYAPPTARLNYELGSIPEDSSLFSRGDNLWQANVATRTERVDLRTNEGGTMEFVAYAYDKACNSTRSTLALPLGDPWISSKGGLMYTSGGTSFDLISLYTNGSLTERLSNDTYWSLPYAVYKSDADLTTELVTSSSPTVNNLLHSTRLNSTRLVNKTDSNNREGYWFDRLTARLGSQIEKDSTKYDVVVAPGDLTVSGTATSISQGGVTCSATSGKNCIVEVGGNLTVNSGFSCNARTLFVVSGTITINPDVTASSMSFGCMFLSRDDVTITAGTFKSSTGTYARFDLFEGFVITDGQILMPAGDSGQPRRDGLKVTGSLLAFDRSGGRSFIVGRNLTLVDANAFPAVAMHFDNRYLNFATTFFGGNTDGYKSEVGFKPL